MTALAFDTLAFSKKLRTQFTPEQAETLAEAFVAGVDEQLATKSDLRELEARLDAKIDGRFAQVDGRFAQVDVRFAQVDVRLANVDVRFAQLETKIAETANKIIIWTAASIFSSAALMIAILKLT